MTPDLSARLAALEAREKARDVLILATARFLVNRSSILYLDRSLTEYEAAIFPAQPAAPPPLAAAPDVIERVREAFKNTIESLELHSRTKPPHHPKSLLGEAREALRLLGARS